MNQYQIVFKDGSFEYLYAYGFTSTGGQYVFDLGHKKEYQVSVNSVERIEVL